MRANKYLKGVVEKIANNDTFSKKEKMGYKKVKNSVKEWNESISPGFHLFGGVKAKVQKSGSRAKGTSIKGTSDIDLFVSITDSKNEYTTRELSESLHTHLSSDFRETRKQNVSTRIITDGCKFDVTSAKQSNSKSHERKDDHYIYSRGQDARMLTNIQSGIEIINSSKYKKEIMLIKRWRDINGLKISSTYIELFVYDALENNHSRNLSENIITVLKELEDTVVTKKIVDPGNPKNIISETMTKQEKRVVKKVATESLEKEDFDEIFR